jgi:MoxR-like ATPase
MTATAPLYTRFQAIEDQLKQVLVEMDPEIHGALLAVVSRSHLFFLGEPGTAKSYLVDHTLAMIDGANVFSILMGNFTGPDDMFGPIDVPKLMESRNCRLTDGYLPSAHYAWLDEGFKASDSILNGMLKIINERQFRNDGEMRPVPLMSMFVASNELPGNDTLKAFFDRILQRFESNPIAEPANFERMLQMESDPTTIEPLVTLDDVRRAQEEVAAMPINPEVFEAITEIRQELKEKDIRPSDRRFKQAIRLLQAEAWLEGLPQVEVDQILVLANVLWDDPGDRLAIDQVLSEKANPRERETMALLDDINKIGDIVNHALEDDDEDRRQAAGMEAHPKILAAFKAVHDIMADPKISRRQRIAVDNCDAILKTHSYNLLNKVFEMSDKDIKELNEKGNAGAS